MAADTHSAANVDEHGHALGCPAYNQPTFTLCTCGAAERAGLDVKFSTEKTGDAAFEQEVEHQRARRILVQLRNWEADQNEPPSLRDGWQRPSDSEIDWARAVLALRVKP